MSYKKQLVRVIDTFVFSFIIIKYSVLLTKRCLHLYKNGNPPRFGVVTMYNRIYICIEFSSNIVYNLWYIYHGYNTHRHTCRRRGGSDATTYRMNVFTGVYSYVICTEKEKERGLCSTYEYSLIRRVS